MMVGYFVPDMIYDTVYEIDFDALNKKNIKGLIFDIDNTLVSYKQETPTENVADLLNGLTNMGFAICFISNNSKERVALFNQKFQYFSFPKAGKPSIKFIKEAIKVMGINAENTAMIGDQIFTDVFAAKRIKIMSILVNPIEPVETLFFKFKRYMEKPFLKKYYKRLNKNYGGKI